MASAALRRCSQRLLRKRSGDFGPSLPYRAPDGLSSNNACLSGQRVAMFSNQALMTEITCGGAMNKEQTEAVVFSKRFKSWVYLCTGEDGDAGISAEGMQVLEMAAENKMIELMHLPLNVEQLSIRGIGEVYETYCSLPRPIFVSCTNALRSHAFKALCESLDQNETVDAMIARISQTKAKGILKSPHIVEWLKAAIIGCRKDEQSLILRPLYNKEFDTYTYIIADVDSREAIIIDPHEYYAERDVEIMDQLELHVLYAVATHLHEDHRSALGNIREDMACETRAPAGSEIYCSKELHDGDKLAFGDHHLEVRSTPGHTNSCISLVMDDRTKAFTGDLLHVRGTGRTDLKTSDPSKMYDSIHNKLFVLPHDCLVYPLRGYQGMGITSIGEEKAKNMELKKSEKEFVAMKRAESNPKPVQMGENLTFNRICAKRDYDDERFEKDLEEFSEQDTGKEEDNDHIEQAFQEEFAKEKARKIPKRLRGPNALKAR